MAGLASGVAKLKPTDVLWPPLHRAFYQMGGGVWRETQTHLHGDFFGGGPIAAHFVARRQCELVRGRVTVTLKDAMAALPRLFQAWLDRLLQLHPLGQAVRRGDLRAVPTKLQPFFAGRLRRKQAEELAAWGEPPRCIRYALLMPAVGPEPSAWKYPMRWDLAKAVRRYAAMLGVPTKAVVDAAIVPAMRARGDSERAVAEFVSHTRGGKTTQFLCQHRTKRAGLFCPITTAVCAAERGISHQPETMSPASVWASKGAKRRRIEVDST